MSFFLPEISIKKKETELSFCLFSDKSPNKRKLILQVLQVLQVLPLLLVLQVLLVLLVLLLLLVLQVRLLLLVLQVLLQELLQELQFFLHSLRKKLSLKERGIREIFSLQDMIFVV